MSVITALDEFVALVNYMPDYWNNFEELARKVRNNEYDEEVRAKIISLATDMADDAKNILELIK